MAATKNRELPALRTPLLTLWWSLVPVTVNRHGPLNRRLGLTLLLNLQLGLLALAFSG